MKTIVSPSSRTDRSGAPESAPVGWVGSTFVVGGGSGHYPAFAGLVGPGLAHAAAMGRVFASPSASQVSSAARAADTGAGVLLAYGIVAPMAG